MLTVPKIGREQSELPVTTMKVTKNCITEDLFEGEGGRKNDIKTLCIPPRCYKGLCTIIHSVTILHILLERQLFQYLLY